MNDLYRKDAMQCQQAACPVTGCSRSGTQCVDISAPVTLTPSAEVGTITTVCQGNPTVVCETNEEGTACTVVLTQRVCVSIPVIFNVALDTGRPSILCADTPC